MKTAWALFAAPLALGYLAGQPPGRIGQIAEEIRDFPQAEIGNGLLKVKLYLPDAEMGYYRATRFDWSGVIPSLEYKGHTFFGQWFPTYNAKVNDSIQGPVEEFGVPPDNAALGYAEARPGEPVVKIGVGAIKKPEGGNGYSSFTTLEIMDNGKWTVRTGPDFAEFTQELKDTNGYAYVYRKTVRLARRQPVMTLEHSLRNTGKKTIETSVYEHDFFMIDNRPTGPEFVVKFPFEAHASRDLAPLAKLEGKELHYLQELQSEPRRQTAQADITGFSDKASDFDFRVENLKTGAGVRETCDRPLTRINFWSIRTTLCPEGYVSLRVAPGHEAAWRIRYEFYTFSPEN
ncbi:MAG: hypothetical protein ABSC23_07720 [Bryobacteraceae bacterium]|jgi:hypothetical protein